MKTKKFVYVLPVLGKYEFPNIRKPGRARMACIVEPNGEVQLVGNSVGLRYLAKNLAFMFLMRKKDGCHVHLEAEEGDLDKGSNKITIRNLDFEE